jgi:predicted TIM-barrel fold metal-dependent hydrolase
MIIDAHASVYPDSLRLKIPKLYPNATMFLDATQEHMMREMDRAGIEKSILWAIPMDGETDCNSWIASLEKKNPDRFIGFATVNVTRGKDAALKELEHGINDLGLHGLKVHPRQQRIRMNDPLVLELAKKAGEMEIPLVFHVASGDATIHAKRSQEEADNEAQFEKSTYLKDISQVYNSFRVMAAHMGGIYNPDIQKTKISFQTAGCSVDAIEYAVKTLGEDRIVFGSDYPFFSQYDEVAKIKGARISDQAKEKILSKNLERMLSR